MTVSSGPSKQQTNPEAFAVSGADLSELRLRLNFSLSAESPFRFREENARDALQKHFGVISIESLGLSQLPAAATAAGALLSYLLDTQKTELRHISHLKVYSLNRFMLLDQATRRNLELCETMREKQKRGSLLWVLDHAKTAMGARTIRRYIEQPLLDKAEILRRQDAVSELVEDPILREELREYLNPVYDLERLL